MHDDSACPAMERLQAFHLGTISGADALAVRNHVGRCEKCRAVLHGFSSETIGTRMIQGGSSAPGLASAVAARAPSHPLLAPPLAAGEIGRLGNYRVVRQLGKGGMGFVFEAEDTGLQRPVALKVMNPSLGDDMEGAQRFLREARIMASLQHEHLVTVYQVGQEGASVYLAMELLKGESLETAMKRIRPFPVGQMVRIGREIAEGLAFIHRNNLVHRDIKPANIWLEAPNGRVKILDFGLARLLDDDTNLTQSGTVLGTPSFMSPEQAGGAPVDARSDLFSLGSVLYVLASGELPFQAPNTMAVLSALAIRSPRAPHELNPALPPALSGFIMELLAKRPEQRPASAEAVVERLRQIEATAGLSAAPMAIPVSSGTLPVAVPVFQSDVVNSSRTALAAGFAKKPAWVKLALVTVGVAAALLLVVKVTRSLVSKPAASVARSKTSSGAQPTGGAKYLTDLNPVAKMYWPFVPPPDLPPKGGPPIDNAVRVKGKAYPHGIFMHPPPPFEGGITSVSYGLGKKYKSFRTKVTMNDGPHQSESPITFVVYGDGKELWRSKPVTSQGDQQECSIPVRGVDVLKIEARVDGEPMGSHAVWLDPVVE